MKGTFAPLAQKGRETRREGEWGERERERGRKREKREEGELAAARRVRRRTF